MRKLLILTSLLTLLSACNQGSDDAKCSSSSNCDENTNAPSISNVKLTIDFEESYFYNKQLAQWNVIDVASLENGSINQKVPVFSEFLNIDLSSALSKIATARLQYQNQGSFNEDSLSSIPYIALKVRGNETFIYNYKKFDAAGLEVAGATGSLIKDGTLAYLPIINAMFDDKFFPPDSTSSQSGYTHKIQIVAQSTGAKSSDVATIIFNADFIIQNKDFDVSYSDEMKDINLSNRWQYFYDSVDSVENTDLELASLIDSSENPESLPVDIRVVFKSAPVIKMNYNVFYEMPLSKDGTGYNDNVSVIRGYEFYEKTYSLTSDRDFGLVFKINDTPVALTNSNREAELRDIPAGELWKLTFGYDLTQNANYPVGKQLLKPLRPLCQLVTGAAFQPLTEANFTKSVEDLGGFVAQCHPETYKKESLSSSDILVTSLELTDTWFDYFSYMPKEDISNNTQYSRKKPGHLYGIKSIEFTIEGCMKLYTREASANPINPNAWQLKNNESESCVTGVGDEDWMAFSISREISIFDDVTQYNSTQGLVELLNDYRTAVPKSRLDFYFNGDNFVEHIH